MKMLDPKGKNRLNLGSGKNYREDCFNVDINPKFNPDIVADITKIDFPLESFEIVFAQDVLNHITPPKAKRLIRLIYKWLKPNGELHIHLANLDFIAEVLYKTENDSLHNEALKWLYGTDGKGNTDYETNIIRWAYSKRELKETLEYLGFDVPILAVDCYGFGMSVGAVKKK